jgi:uncharacterized membrane protein YdjX (TVP38/TMEM64 family)
MSLARPRSRHPRFEFWRKWGGPLFAFFLFVTALFVLLQLRERGLIDPERLASYFQQIGSHWWSPVIFILLFCTFGILALPGSLLTIIAGVVWGWFQGGIWALIGSTFGTALPYMIARHGAPWAKRWIEKRAGRFIRALRKEGFTALLTLRLLPLVPYNVLNYASGVAGIAPRPYITATFLGTAPGLFIYTYMADSLFNGLLSPRTAVTRVAIAGVLLAVLVIGTRIFATRMQRRGILSNLEDGDDATEAEDAA